MDIMYEDVLENNYIPLIDFSMEVSSFSGLGF